MSEGHEEIMKMLKASDVTGRASFPPNVSYLLEGEFIKYEPGQSMTMRFPVKSEFDNPFHITFGGVYGMYFDMAFGPFSGLVTKAATTSLDLNVCFLKPLSTADKYVTVRAEVVSQSKQFLILEGKAYKGDPSTLIATATSRMMIFDPKRMKL